MHFEKVKEVIVDTLNIDEELITETASLKEDLGIDSLDAVELCLALEEAYGISIPQEDLAELTTIPKILAYIESHVNE